MVTALIFLGGLGAVSALLLGVAARVFYVKEDPKIAEVEGALPGANCGGCGFAGCHACAEAIVAGEAPANACVVGGFETAVAVAGMMGVKVEAKEPEIASTSCTFGTEEADLIYRYNGAQDCQAAVALFGGAKLCPIGCIGLGSCVKACKFDALSIGPDHLPRFNPNKCVACGACVKACPKHIIRLTSSSRRMVGEYTSAECTAPCMRGCPTGIDIPRYVAAIRDGHPEEALRIIKEKCPLPLICGRICPAPCERECRRNLAGDDPVAINLLKRYAADYEMRTGQHINPYKNAPTDRRVAVVGAGAEGLTASYYLARLGHSVTLYDAKPQLGGILRHVIAPGRLPEGALEHEIQGILDMGVAARTGQQLGRDFTIPALLADEFDAVVLTTGGFDSRKILAAGDGRTPLVPGVHLLVDFLDAAARNEPLAIGRRVVITGSSARLVELARACRERGAGEVILVADKQRRDLPEELKETRALTREGIQVVAGTVVATLWGAGERLAGVTLEPSAPGPGTLPPRTVAVDTLILLAGRIPELLVAPLRSDAGGEGGHGGGDGGSHGGSSGGGNGGEGSAEPIEGFKEICSALGIRPTWRTVDIFRSYPAANQRGILSSPEAGRISDASAVVKAILSGRRIVRGIHQHLAASPIESLESLASEAEEILNVDQVFDVSPAPRQGTQAPAREPSTAADWRAVGELPGLTEAEARQEGQRCLQCGLICYRKTV